jgi:hypothetical protein
MMMMLTAAFFAQAAAAVVPPEKPPGKVGACAWEKLPVADRTRVLDAYHRERAEGLQTLMLMDDAVAVALKACAPAGRPPAIFLNRALWAEMTLAGAARELNAVGVDRPRLEAAWSQAPATARLCLRNRLGSNFGMATPACADDAEGDMARSLNIDGADLRLQASIFYLAKAESELAETMIANSPF